MPKLQVSEKVINRLKKVKENGVGYLYGVFDKNIQIVIGLKIKADESDDLNSAYSFPTEIDKCGVIEIGHTDATQLVEDVYVTDTPVYIICKIEEDRENTIAAFFSIDNALEEVKFEIINEDKIYRNFIHVRLLAQVPFTCSLKPPNIEDSFLHLRKTLACGEVGFTFPDTNIYLMGGKIENNLLGLSSKHTVGQLCPHFNERVGEGCDNSCKKNPYKETLTVRMFKILTAEGERENQKRHAPVIHIDKDSRTVANMMLNIDNIALVCKQTLVVNLYEILVESCNHFLQSLQSRALQIFDETGDSIVPKFDAFHFYPETCGHFVTRILAKNVTEKGDGVVVLHKQMLLPLTKPLFRKGLKYVFGQSDKDCGGLLVNPHEGLKPSGNGGEIATVTGKYQYYHYCQNKMDDSGWGCAYRSLQTLASWFYLQGYTDREVPTFKDIQKCLVDIGDKPSSFIDSRQWIGSTEVSFVLNTLLDVTSRIMFVSSGEELGSKGQELLSHFRTQGTPIMIGGGVLAHTILGVDYNQETGNIKFLILDPHFTGGEDLHVILKKGWCGWKGINFWDKSSYYNLCMPLAPKCI